MENLGPAVSRFGLDEHGLGRVRRAYWNLPAAWLYEEAVCRKEACLSREGALICHTGEFTGRSPEDKFVVEEPSSRERIAWGKVNRPISPERFAGLATRVGDYLADKDVFVFDGYAGADPRYRIKVRVVTEAAWQNLFAQNMFLHETDPGVLSEFRPDWLVVDALGFRADPARDGTRSGTFILVHFGERQVLIGGTQYGGEIKKSIFSVLNYELPLRGVFPMHCSANYGRDRDDVALFFGLSGTGKTTLSADPARTLIGDDEHGWSDEGIFNFEGGCYAKVIRLSREGEPDIWEASHRFGTILENVDFDPRTRALDLDSARLTENTRASYPLAHLRNRDLGGCAGHPRHILFLTCDAYGVLPPLARLTPTQAMYHFLSGYTARVAGTERGVKEPAATFSTCFGSPFLPLPASAYAELLGVRLRRHGAQVWLVNTGWTGGPYGVGRRMDLAVTRKLVESVLCGALDEVPVDPDPIFGLGIPRHVPGVSEGILCPWKTWSDRSHYDATARDLAARFERNFSTFAPSVSQEVRAAGPRL